MAESILILENVSLIREGRYLLNSIDLSLSSGEILSILGANGAGKSSLLSCIGLGSNLDYSGKIKIQNKDIKDLPGRKKAKLLSLLPQQSSLNFPLRVRDVVMLGRYPHATSTSINLSIIDSLLKRLNLTKLASRNYMTLSGGEKQRVQIARVLAQLLVSKDMSPYPNSILLLDEPLSALDLPYQSIFMNFAKELCEKGLSLIAIFHDINIAANYSDRCFFMKNGKLISDGKTEEVITSKNIFDTYGVQVDVIEHPKTTRPHIILDYE